MYTHNRHGKSNFLTISTFLAILERGLTKTWAEPTGYWSRTVFWYGATSTWTCFPTTLFSQIDVTLKF